MNEARHTLGTQAVRSMARAVAPMEAWVAYIAEKKASRRKVYFSA